MNAPEVIDVEASALLEELGLDDSVALPNSMTFDEQDPMR